MEDNPYSVLADMMAEKPGRLMLFTGIVTKTSPLEVTVEGIVLSGSDIKVNASLLPQSAAITMTGLSGNLNGSVDCAVGAITGMAVTGGNLTTAAVISPSINLDDELLLLTSDMQVFNVLCKVVSA